ncbi:hypothetical protein ACQ4PT_057606 [Festuca glaucescens]
MRRRLSSVGPFIVVRAGGSVRTVQLLPKLRWWRRPWFRRSKIFGLSTKSLQRPRRRLGSTLPQPRDGGADLISALPDDLLLLVLARLRCASTAVRTSVLGRRWRALWTCLPLLTFRDVGFRELEPALAQVSVPSPALSLDIHVPDTAPTGPCVTSLLRAAARLSPEELVFNLPLGVENLSTAAELPCFQRATSIELGALFLFIEAPPSDCPFPMLTTLVLSGITVHALTALVPRCPRLRVLRFATRRPSQWNWGERDIRVHSASLQELVLESEASLRYIEVATPKLNQLTMSTVSCVDFSLSVLAPKAEKVSWRCDYGLDGVHTGFGLWRLDMLSLTTTEAERRQPPLLRIDARKANSYYPVSLGSFRMAQAVETHLQMQLGVGLSVLDLELHVTPSDHVYGAFVLCVLAINQIHSATRRLKVALLEPKFKRLQWCHDDCPCEPTDWRNQTIPLTELEEVEIDGFKGYEHEFELLELVFRCAPMLKKVTVKPSRQDEPSKQEIYDMFNANPSVECCLEGLAA